MPLLDIKNVSCIRLDHAQMRSSAKRIYWTMVSPILWHQSNGDDLRRWCGKKQTLPRGKRYEFVSRRQRWSDPTTSSRSQNPIRNHRACGSPLRGFARARPVRRTRRKNRIEQHVAGLYFRRRRHADTIDAGPHRAKGLPVGQSQSSRGVIDKGIEIPVVQRAVHPAMRRHRSERQSPLPRRKPIPKSNGRPDTGCHTFAQTVTKGPACGANSAVLRM